MASKPIANRTIHCLLGTYCEDQWCPHTVQAALVADSNWAPVVLVGPIVVGSNGDGKELLAHPLGLHCGGK